MRPILRPPDPDERLFGTAVPARVIAGDSMLRSLWVALAHRRLDRRIAQGTDPMRSAAIAVRSRQLTNRKVRDKLADTIDRLLRSADEPSPRSSMVHPAVVSVRAARVQLVRISEILHSDDLVYARGVALSGALLFDGESPLYSASQAGAAWHRAQLAVRALEGHI